MRKAILAAVLSLCLAASAYASCRCLTFTTEAIPMFYVDVPGYYQIDVWGGTPPYTFQITAGSLPSGLSMNSSGEISGTPTVATYSHTIYVKVTDSVGCHLTQGYPVYVDP